MGHSKTLFAMAILTVALSLMTFALSADSDADPPTTGQCGDDMHWTFYPDQSRLVIEGAGKMYDYSIGDEKWGRNLDDSESSVSVEISEGVTGVGKYAFSGCEALKTVTIPDTVTYIGQYAFFNCNILNRIVIPYSVEFLGNDAFGILQFCDINGKKLSTEATDLHGYIYKRNTDNYLQALPPEVCTVSFVDTGGTSLAESMNTGNDGKLSDLPEAT